MRRGLLTLAGSGTHRSPLRSLFCLPCRFCLHLLPCLHPHTPRAYLLLALTSKPLYRSSLLLQHLRTRHSDTDADSGLLTTLCQGSGTVVLIAASGWVSWILAANAASDRVTSPVMTVTVSMTLAFILASAILSIVSFSADAIRLSHMVGLDLAKY